MLVRSLTSSILRWPDAATVDRALRRWAREMARQRPELRRVGYFGSYARGDWGPGSDLDVVVVIASSAQLMARRLGDQEAGGLEEQRDQGGGELSANPIQSHGRLARGPEGERGGTIGGAARAVKGPGASRPRH